MTDTDFSDRTWVYHGDETAEERVIRVLKHYDIEDRWWVGDALRFTTRHQAVEDAVELAVSGTDANLEFVHEHGGNKLYRVQFADTDDGGDE